MYGMSGDSPTPIDFSCPWWLKVEHERIERGWSRKQIADALGRRPGVVNRWLTGQSTPADSLHTLDEIATLFGWTEPHQRQWMRDDSQPWLPQALLRAAAAGQQEWSEAQREIIAALDEPGALAAMTLALELHRRLQDEAGAEKPKE